MRFRPRRLRRAPFWSLGVASSFAARGMHSAWLAWLLAVPLGASGLSAGGVQALALGAQAAALLAAGASARVGARRTAVAVALAASLPPFAMALHGPSPGLAVVLGYALASGALWGLLSPARDALVARGAGGDLLRPMSGFTAAQFAGVLAGVGAASAAPGAAALLVGQALLHVLSALCIALARSAPAPDRAASEEDGRARAPYADGPAQRAGGAREIVFLSGLLGLCAAGPFSVWVPLLASEAGAAPARRIGILLALFPLGTLVGSLALRRVGAALDKRATALAAHGAGSLCIVGAGCAPGFPAEVACFATWGLCGAVFINCGRALLLEHCRAAEHAARLARVQLALLLASPLGALAAGALAERVGTRGSMLLLGTVALAGAAALARRAPRFVGAGAGP